MTGNSRREEDIVLARIEVLRREMVVHTPADIQCV